MKKKLSITSFLNQNKTYMLVAVMAIIVLVLVMSDVVTVGTAIATPSFFAEIAYTMILVVSLNLVVGFLGELSLGHAGFMYIGAYVSGIVLYYTQNLIALPILRFCLAALAGSLAAMVFGFVVGLPALRLRGDYLAIVTLAFGEIVRGVIKNIKIGNFIKVPADGFIISGELTKSYATYIFLIGFVAVLVTIFCIQNIIKSKHGRAVTAIKDNEIAARAMGVNITYYKLIIFAIAAFFAGLAGAIYSNFKTVSPDAFDYNYSIEILVMVVLGGMGSVFGSLVSPIIIVLLNNVLTYVLTSYQFELTEIFGASFASNIAGIKNFIYALVLILMMLFSSAPAFVAFRERLFGKFKKKDKAPQKVVASAEKGDAEK